MRVAILIMAVCIFVLAQNAPTFAVTNACSLLTQAQVNAATGLHVSAGKNVVGGPGICDWEDSRASSTIRVYLEDASHWKPISHSSDNGVIRNTLVSGVGDAAVYTSVRANVGLNVKKGRHVIMVIAFGLPFDVAKSAEMKLARIILSHI